VSNRQEPYPLTLADIEEIAFERSVRVDDLWPAIEAEPRVEDHEGDVA
jgi:hypothetical protein